MHYAFTMSKPPLCQTMDSFLPNKESTSHNSFYSYLQFILRSQ